jgi:hypothetical protein
MKFILLLFFLLSTAKAANLVNATVWHSTIFQPNVLKIKYDARDLSLEENSVARGNITVVHKGPSCDFKTLAKMEFAKWRKDCQLVVQFLFSTEYYLEFAKLAQIEMPPRIEITIEDEMSPCHAAASYTNDLGEVGFCPIDPEDLDIFLKYGADVLFHELTHIALKNQTTEEFILSSAYEDFPTVFSYLVSGRSTFKTTEDTIYDPNVSFGSVAPGNYGSLLALSTSLIDLQKAILAKIPSLKEKDEFYYAYARILIDSFFMIDSETTEQDVLNEVISRTERIYEGNLDFFTKKLLARGMDLAQNIYNGLLTTVLVNDVSITVPPTYVLSASTPEQAVSPTIRLHDSVVRIKDELTGMILPFDHFAELQKCLDQSTYGDFNKIRYNCLKSMISKDRFFVFKRNNDSYQISPKANDPSVFIVYLFDRKLIPVYSFTVLTKK